MDLNSIQKRMDDWFSKPENIEHARKYFEALNAKEQMHDNQVERFADKVKSGAIDFNALVEKLREKYESNKYAMSWYNRGIEPPRNLYFFLYDFAKKYGREFTEQEYSEQEYLMFTEQIFVYGEWCFEVIHGQGSACLVYKYTERRTNEKK